MNAIDFLKAYDGYVELEKENGKYTLVAYNCNGNYVAGIEDDFYAWDELDERLDGSPRSHLKGKLRIINSQTT